MQRFFACFLVFALGCGGVQGSGFEGEVELVLLHTSDLHSALFPYREKLGWADARRGLGTEGTTASIGGAARLATLVGRERALAERSLVLDSGDAFQGSLAFDTWSGEPELLFLGALGVRAQALGNHELDRGAENVVQRYRELATFPLLAANYSGDATAGVAELVSPFAVLDVRGLRVGVVGVANARSVPALRERPNELGVAVLETAGAVQGALDALRPVVDVVVVLTHLGLDADHALVRETSGIDVVLGGHQHLALDEPAVVLDCAEGTVMAAGGHRRRCVSRRVPVVHSGAYAKYLGKLSLRLDDAADRVGPTYEPLDAHEVTSATFELLPAHAGVPEDAAMRELLEPFRAGAFAGSELGGAVGFAPRSVARAGVTGGDSPLGNVAADAVRRVAGTELALIGASSLRRDLAPGAFDTDALERSFPFDDPVVRVRTTGRALRAAFERAAETAFERDCRTPVHVSGASVRFRCPCERPPCADVFVGATALCCRDDAECAPVGGACGAAPGELGWCFLPLVSDAAYELATTAYVADGNGGFFARIASGDRSLAAPGLREAVGEMLHDAEPCDGVPDELRHLPCLDERVGARRDGRLRIERP
ncbi:MAG TPA: bifunctional metallophosphatase/5'-nucleotidase [Polyangiaceae bacterium]